MFSKAGAFKMNHHIYQRTCTNRPKLTKSMEDCWLENEEFNFDIPLELSPASGEKCDVADKASNDENDDYDDEVFFGPVGHLERCAAVAAKKENVDPLKPLEPAEQALLLQESAKLSCLLKLKPLSAIQNGSPGAMIYPFKRDSSGIDITKLRLFRDKLSSKEEKENKENDGENIDLIQGKDEIDSLKEKKQVGNSDGAKVSKLDPSPSCKSTKLHHRSFSGAVGRKLQASETSIPVGPVVSKIQSKIARPSSIPSLKPGLLQGQTRLRGATSQDSKLKPLKALKSASALTHEPIAGDNSKRSIPSTAATKFVTPKKNSEATHVRSNTADRQTRRRSTDLSPKKNSEAKHVRSNTADRQTRRRSTDLSPKKNSEAKHVRSNTADRQTRRRSTDLSPKKNSEAKHVRSNTADKQTRRRSTDLSTSMSQLQLSRPSHNSTPIQVQLPAKQGSGLRRSTGSAVASMKVSSCATNTPAKVKSGKLLDSANKQKRPETPSNKLTLFRRSFVPKPNSSHTNTPLIAKSGQRRASLLKYPNSKLSPDKKKSTDGNTSMVRSDTFVISGTSDKPTVNPAGKPNMSLIDIGINESDSVHANDVIATSTSDEHIVENRNAPGTSQHVLPETVSDNHVPLAHQGDILVPEVRTVHMSPLLKFDSPLPECTICDPFATGHTPPSLPVSDGVLAPEQMEANLIQF